MSATSDKLARQVGLIQAGYGVRFNSGTNVPENIDVQTALAVYLEGQGLQDIRDLRYYENRAANLSFFFDVRTGKRLINPSSGDSIHYVDRVANPYQGAGSVMFFDGRWDGYYIQCRFSPDGYPLFYSLNIKHLHAWAETFAAVASLAAIACSVCFPGLGAAIGSAVLGPELAAAYPLVASGIGNVAIQTTLSGGDVESAVIGAVSGGVGSGVGGLVTGATNSAVIGSATAAATKSAIVGGNIGEAVLGSLVGQGISSLSQLDLFSMATPAAPAGSISMAQDYWDEFGGGGDVSMDPTWSAPPEVVAPVYDWQWSGASVDPLATGVYDPTPLSSPDLIDPQGSVLVANGNAPPPGPSGIVASSGGADLTQLALTALKFVGAWSGAGQPPLRASNATTTANANGTVTVRNPNGSVSTVKMPVGTPYLTSTGQLVTNNGDGTYSSIDSRGQVSTGQYPAAGSGLLSFSSLGLGGVSPVVLGLGAVVALLLLRR